MYEWSDIRSFLAVHRLGSAAAAARALGTNQTTISRRIARLEAALRLKLFDPGARGAAPTSAARDLLPLAEEMERAAANLETRAGGMSRTLSGTIHLTANATAIRYAAGLLREFQRLHPDARFEVDTEHRNKSLEAGEADVALRVGVRLEGDTLIARKLMDHPWGFYASDSYIAQYGAPTSLADFPNHSFVVCNGEFSGSEPMPLSQARFPPDAPTATIGSLDGCVGLVRAGEGIGALPRAEGDVEPNLRFLFREADMLQGVWIVTTRERHADPLVSGFMRFCGDKMKDVLRDLPPEWRA